MVLPSLRASSKGRQTLAPSSLLSSAYVLRPPPNRGRIQNTKKGSLHGFLSYSSSYRMETDHLPCCRPADALSEKKGSAHALDILMTGHFFVAKEGSKEWMRMVLMNCTGEYVTCSLIHLQTRRRERRACWKLEQTRTCGTISSALPSATVSDALATQVPAFQA